MKKKILILSMTLILLLGTTTISFATNNNSDNYEINSVPELKEELSEINNSPINPISKNTSTNIEEKTDPIVIKEFIEEKDAKIEKILEKEDEPLSSNEAQESYEKTYNLGDNCWIKFEIEEEEITEENTNIISALKSKLIPETYALSRSGYKTGWQKYKAGRKTGKYSYTAKTTVHYGVASATYALRAYYQLTSKGIKVYDSLATGTDSGVADVSLTKETITDATATKPGASDCNLYATYKTKYGKDSLTLSRAYKMSIRIKYLSKDTVEKEIKTTREWRLKSL